MNQFRIRYLLKDAQPGDFVHLFANSPIVVSEAKNRGCIVIFDLIHNWWNFPYHQNVQIRNLKKNIQLADIIISDSELTLELAKRDLGKIVKPMRLIPPGVEDFWFVERVNYQPTTPASIVFFGNLRANSDVNLIHKLRKNKNISLTLFGLLDQTLKKQDLQEFSKDYKGQFPPQDLVKQINFFDMVLLPYDKSSFSKTIFPAKYFEAFALGKPVISDSDLFHLPGWKDFIWTSDDLENLGPADLIRRHYLERSESQVALARLNSWTERIKDLNRLLDGKI